MNNVNILHRYTTAAAAAKQKAKRSRKNCADTVKQDLKDISQLPKFHGDFATPLEYVIY